MASEQTMHQPACGRAHQARGEAWETILAREETDASVLARKGRLYLLCRLDAPPSLRETVAEAYYTASSYDVLPSLSAALARGYGAADDAHGQLPLAVVVQGLDVYAVGTQEARLWGGHSAELRELLAPSAEGGPWPRGAVCWQNQAGPTLYGVCWRLWRDDVLIMTTQDAATRLSRQKLESALRDRDPAAVAQSIARRAKGKGSAPQPVTVLQLGGLQPVPEMGPIRRQTPAPAAPKLRHRRPRGESSPIWMALLIAVVAVGVTFWLRPPSINRTEAEALLEWFLTPAPLDTAPESGGVADTPRPPAPTMVLYAGTPRPTATLGATARPASSGAQPGGATASTATPEPEAELYPAPRLLSPYENQGVRDATITMRWSWAGTLAEDEYFDVRLWRVGTSKQGIAWTKRRDYVERHPSTGWYFWTVAVVRGQDGEIVAELSAEPEPVGFRWASTSDEGPGPPRPTSVPSPTSVPPPTRVAPPTRVQPQPTSVTPGADQGD
jgi:hypothetical protein